MCVFFVLGRSIQGDLVKMIRAGTVYVIMCECSCNFTCHNLFKVNLDKNLSNKVLKENFIKYMKLMLPFTPHISSECLELLNCEDFDKWPAVDKSKIISKINLVVQINGKTRGILNIKTGFNEKEILEKIKKMKK